MGGGTLFSYGMKLPSGNDTPLQSKEEKGNQEMTRGRRDRTFSEKSRLEKDLRGDGEERNERVRWLKNAESNRMLLIMIGTFRVGLDGRVREASSDNTEGGAGDVERSWVNGVVF